MNQQAIFGFQEEWEQFQTRNEKFLSKYSALQAALDKAFSRTVSTSKPGDRVIFGLGRLCAEDFLEILLLAGNGYGIAALKLLRGLNERAVTISYLSEHPGKATAFLDYHFVSQHKVLTELRAIGLEERFPRDEREKVEAEYQRVKHNYLVTGCKECGAKRMNHTWSKLDVVAMAKSTDLGKLLAMAYYLPVQHAHSTVAALLARIEQSSSGGIAFNPGSQPKEADIALMVAHDVILHVLEVQEQYFKLAELHEDLQIAMHAFVEIWSKKENNIQEGDTGS